MIVYFSADLMSGSRVQGPANAQGIALKIYGSQKACLEALNDDISALVVDLNPPARDAISTIQEARAQHADLRNLVHGPHVQVDMLKAAKEAGASEVLTNGQFHQQVEAILVGLENPPV